MGLPFQVHFRPIKFVILDTNTFLSIGLALITNFGNLVHVPPELVPRATSDLQHCVVGGPRSPFDLHVVHQRGTLFWIEDGAVIGYRGPGSFFAAQDIDHLNQYRGRARLSTNEVVELAEKTVRALLKAGDTITNSRPQIQLGGQFRDGENVPFYRVNWPGKGMFGYVAQIEVDARNGTIPALWIGGDQFRDPAYAAEISNRVWHAEPAVPVQRSFPQPLPEALPWTTNQVVRALANRGRVLAAFNVPLEPTEGLPGVAWEASYSLPGADYRLAERFCFLQFTNGAQLTCSASLVFGYASADFWHADLPSNDPVNKQYYTSVAYDWEKLALDFEQLLCRRFGFVPRDFADMARVTEVPPGRVGETGLSYAGVLWVLKHPPETMFPGNPPSVWLFVSFDLRTGLIKSFHFRRKEWRERFMKAQEKL